MAVYKHTYRPYTGEVTPLWSRFLVIPRHAFKSVFQSKFFLAFFIACLIYPLIAAIVIYLPHNESAKAIMKMTIGDLIGPDRVIVGLRPGDKAQLLQELASRAAVATDLQDRRRAGAGLGRAAGHTQVLRVE